MSEATDWMAREAAREAGRLAASWSSTALDRAENVVLQAMQNAASSPETTPAVRDAMAAALPTVRTLREVGPPFAARVAAMSVFLGVQLAAVAVRQARRALEATR